MPYKHDDKSSGQLIRSADWNSMGHAVQDLDTNKVNRAGDTMQGDLSVTGKLSASVGQFATSLGSSGGLDIAGNASLGADLTVAGQLKLTGDLSVNGKLNLNNSDIYFLNTTHQHTGIGNAPGCAAIENDSVTYDALMILGRSRASGVSPRRVRLWDYLHVHGAFEADNICAGTPFRVGAGRTPIGSTAWQVYGPTGIFVDVPTGAAGFSQTPIYVVSLGGNSGHWATTGGTSVYNATNGGFRIYVRWVDNSALAPAAANANGWHIEWVGIQV
jgi:hypothetical protein